MKVRADVKGFDGLSIRMPGEEFELPEGSRGSWFTVLEAKPESKLEKEVLQDFERMSHVAKDHEDRKPRK
jgi:hypothetical protein